mmetsp:Transcript_6195/g.12128  ORF Transcript_6195/g.12128 Transcript_6195/m.12128 type:complete len:216 (-) Transcript_6195:486-1133(-)
MKSPTRTTTPTDTTTPAISPTLSEPPESSEGERDGPEVGPSVVGIATNGSVGPKVGIDVITRVGESVNFVGANVGLGEIVGVATGLAVGGSVATGFAANERITGRSSSCNPAVTVAAFVSVYNLNRLANPTTLVTLEEYSQNRSRSLRNPTVEFGSEIFTPQVVHRGSVEEHPTTVCPRTRHSVSGRIASGANTTVKFSIYASSFGTSVAFKTRN